MIDTTWYLRPIVSLPATSLSYPYSTLSQRYSIYGNIRTSSARSKLDKSHTMQRLINEVPNEELKTLSCTHRKLILMKSIPGDWRWETPWTGCQPITGYITVLNNTHTISNSPRICMYKANVLTRKPSWPPSRENQNIKESHEEAGGMMGSIIVSQGEKQWRKFTQWLTWSCVSLAWLMQTVLCL